MTRPLGGLWQDTWQIGFWGLQCSIWCYNDWRSHHTQDVVLDLLCHMDTMLFCRQLLGTLCTDSSLYSIACPVPLPISLIGQTGHRQGELVQPGL